MPKWYKSVRDLFNFRPIFHKWYRERLSGVVSANPRARTMNPMCFRHHLPFIKQKKTTNMIKKHTTRPKTSCEDVKGSMPQRPVRVSRGSTLREQGSRGNADMDLFVAKTRERGNQTPTLSGEAIGEEGEKIIKSEILLWHQHETKTRVGIKVLTLLSYHPVKVVTPKPKCHQCIPLSR